MSFLNECFVFCTSLILGGLRSSHGNYSDEQLARISQINGSFTHSVSRLFQVSQHHPRGRKGVQGSPAYREKVYKFIDEYKKEKLFTCPKRRRVGTGVGQNFICAYTFIEDGNEEEESKGCQKFATEYIQLAEKLDLERMVCK